MISGQQLITMQSEYLLLYSLSQWKCFKSFIGFVYLHKSSEILYHIWPSFESQINIFGLGGHSVYFVKQKIVAPSSNIRALYFSRHARTVTFFCPLSQAQMLLAFSVSQRQQREVPCTGTCLLLATWRSGCADFALLQQTSESDPVYITKYAPGSM